MRRSEGYQRQDPDIIGQLKKTNFYDMLDLKSKASEEQIKKSYKKLALKYHPDKNSASTSKQVFHKLSEAYSTLSDPQKRNIYDQKQNANLKRQTFNFAQSNPHSKNSSAFFKYQKQSAEFEQMFSEKFMQSKMDEKARQERQNLKRQTKQNQKNPYFKSNHQKSAKNQNKQKSANNQANYFAEQSWQEIYRKQGGTFSFSKGDFGKKTSNRPKFEQYQNSIDKKIRLQKKKQKVQNNLRQLKIVVLLVVVWAIFSYFGPSMRGSPVFSMHSSSEYKISHFTKQLQSPFFIKEQYLERTAADDEFREYVDRKIDLIYIKTLSRVCNTMLQKQQELELRLSNVKSKKSKKKIIDQIDKIDLSSCDKLHEARERNPAYFKNLIQESPVDSKAQEMM